MRRCLVCNFCSMVEAHAPLFPVDWRCEACQWSPRSERNVALLAPELADDTLGFDSAAFSDLEAIEDGHFWFEPRNRLIAGLTERFFPAARSYLEIGCGTGFVFRRMAGLREWTRLVGSELQPAGLRVAQRRLGKPAEWLQMDARSLPVREEFDLLGCYDVLEHVQDDEAVLEEVYAALRPGGGAILAVPQHPMLWSALDERVHHVRRYRRDELEKKAKAAGFRILFSSSYTFATLPLMIASRMTQKINRSSSSSRNKLEFRPPFIVNAILRAVLHLEVTLTMAGLRWPAGGSRIVVVSRSR